MRKNSTFSHYLLSVSEKLQKTLTEAQVDNPALRNGSKFTNLYNDPHRDRQMA